MRSILLASALVIAGLQASAKPPEALSLSDGKLYAPLKGSPATAAYGVFQNYTDADIKLSIVKSSAFKAVETHQTLEKDGKMAMEKVDTFTVPAKGSLVLKPGGNHIMLFDAKKTLKENDSVKITFKQDGKDKDFAFKVVPRVEEGAAAEQHHHH